MLTEKAGSRSGLRRLVNRAVGVVDAVAAPHGLDRYLELALPTWSSTEVRGRVVDVARTTAGTVTLTLRPNGNWTGFRAGQHTELSVEIEGVRHTRSYSMANSAHDAALIELTIKAQAGGRVSSYLVEDAAPGLVVGLTPADGEFTLPDVRPARLLLISGGSGITPVMSMLRTLCAEGHARPVTFVHYALTAADQCYSAELSALAAANPSVRVVRVYTEEPGAGDLDGLFSSDQLDAAEPRWAEAEVFVCGPAPLMNAVRAHFAEHGLSDRYHDEAFTLGQLVAEATGGQVHFAESAVDVRDDGRPLLVQAEAAGLRPASGCRMGICHTCACPLLRGAVRDLTTGEITDEPGSNVRVCVSAPIGDVALAL